MLAAISPTIKVPQRLRGFSGGLATGLLVSAVVTAVFLFHGYRRQVGEALIQWGERLATKPQAQMQPASSEPQLSARQAVSPARRTVSPPTEPIPVQPPVELPPPTLVHPVESQQAKLEPVHPPKPQRQESPPARTTTASAVVAVAVGAAPAPVHAPVVSLATQDFCCSCHQRDVVNTFDDFPANSCSLAHLERRFGQSLARFRSWSQRAIPLARPSILATRLPGQLREFILKSPNSKMRWAPRVPGTD